jgi:hypothetical protein
MATSLPIAPTQVKNFLTSRRINPEAWDRRSHSWWITSSTSLSPEASVNAAALADPAPALPVERVAVDQAHLRRVDLLFLRHQRHPWLCRDFTFMSSTGRRRIQHLYRQPHRPEASVDSVRLPLHPQPQLLLRAGSKMGDVQMTTDQ